MAMIYVVDDAADYRFLVEQVFKRFLPQYPVRLFSDGMELIEAIEARGGSPGPQPPKVILLDVDMPKFSGPQTLMRLRQFPAWKAVPVVMLSNRTDDSFIEVSYQLGACSFLLKPVGLEQLKTVMSLLGQYWVGLNQLPDPDVNQTTGS